ncbi:hypothetical protein BD779DRAFT_411981 [Infundibulicybe gibba]|nr:hypothetical protein BD779DRAFT_411981 [Infundibulicybe gibba]
MPLSATGTAEAQTLFPQLHQRLVESGEWDRIKSVLDSKLNDSGWTDDLRHQSKEQARSMDPLSFHALLKETTTRASLPLSIKKDIVSLIRNSIEKQLD